MLKHGCLAVALVLGGCSAEEPAWEEGPIGEISEGLTVGGAGGCSTFIVDGLSKQLIAEENCIAANTLVSFSGKKGISIGSNVYPYLEPKAAAGLEAAGASSTLSVTSAFRTLAQQYLLYRWYEDGTCGISLAAVPGNSNHETGTAVDLSNYSAEIGNMSNHGWTHTYPSSDPVHFDYTAGGTTDLRHDSVLAFQRLWNLNNASAKLTEDGEYGPMTAAKVAASPATGFAKGSSCAPSTPGTPAPTQTEWAAELGDQSLPTALGAGELQPAWVEFKNTGTSTWEPGTTRLGTTDPQDRESALASPDWIAANRPATVDAETKPGETGRFTFTVRGPVVSSAESLTEHFGLVEESVSWFPATAALTVDVMISPAAVPSGDPQDSTEGGATPTPAPAQPSMGAHSGCSMGAGDTSNSFGLLLALLGLTLVARRRASYSQGRCHPSRASSSFSSSRSR